MNRFFYPDYSATSQMLTDLTFGLAERGAEVSVITSRLLYEDARAALPTRERVRGVDIERVWTSRYGRTGLVFRLIDYLTFYFSAALTLARSARRGDIVVAMTDPPALSILALVLAWSRGAHLVNWLQDVFPEVAEALQLAGKRSPLLFRPLRLLRDLSLRRASMNVAIGSLMAERLLQLGVTQDRMIMIPNWADTNAIRPVPPMSNRLRSDWGLSEKFVVAYSGNLGRAHGIETLVDAMTITGQNGEPEIHWLFVGGGVGLEQLKRAAEELGIANLTFRPYQPRENLSQSLSVADVHVVLLRPALEGLIVPSKFYGIAAAGRPIIFVGAADGEIARLIMQYGCGATIASGDGIGLAETLSTMAKNTVHCRRQGERARGMCEENFSKEQAISAWNELLERVERPRAISRSNECCAEPTLE
ncbi:glycosyltransferase family 4 protein [Hyphomicrobium sp. 99]|uniref:glycosyltransferase family 4 protein n=1 Tax=Hyphomicrobium sp. 99 TaxID=1163419 RepID=UPI0018CEFB7A|nr:glycosyltransferase family 4 protein [Hyphomicrobium sp. 99]